MKPSLFSSGLALAAIAYALLCSGCMVQTNPDGSKDRKVDPEARRFWAGVAVRTFINYAK